MHEHDKDDHLEDCKICSAYDDFDYLISDGVSTEDAFHAVFSSMAEDLIESILDIGMEDGFGIGYSQAIRDISEQTGQLADKLDEALDEECTCGCEEDNDDIEITYTEASCGVDCGCEAGECEFDETCGDCDCAEDECEIEEISKSIFKAVDLFEKIDKQQEEKNSLLKLNPPEKAKEIKFKFDDDFVEWIKKRL